MRKSQGPWLLSTGSTFLLFGVPRCEEEVEELLFTFLKPLRGRDVARSEHLGGGAQWWGVQLGPEDRSSRECCLGFIFLVETAALFSPFLPTIIAPPFPPLEILMILELPTPAGPLGRGHTPPHRHSFCFCDEDNKYLIQKFHVFRLVCVPGTSRSIYMCYCLTRF